MLKIARTQVGNVLISTIQLPINHGSSDRPLWYESMAFACDDDGQVTSWSDLSCKRYETVAEAHEGHAAMVQFYTNR